MKISKLIDLQIRAEDAKAAGHIMYIQGLVNRSNHIYLRTGDQS